MSFTETNKSDFRCWEITGNEEYVLLGHDAAQLGNGLATFLGNILLSSSVTRCRVPVELSFQPYRQETLKIRTPEDIYLTSPKKNEENSTKNTHNFQRGI